MTEPPMSTYAAQPMCLHGPCARQGMHASSKQPQERWAAR